MQPRRLVMLTPIIVMSFASLSTPIVISQSAAIITRTVTTQSLVTTATTVTRQSLVTVTKTVGKAVVPQGPAVSIDVNIIPGNGDSNFTVGDSFHYNITLHNIGDTIVNSNFNVSVYNPSRELLGSRVFSRTILIRQTTFLFPNQTDSEFSSYDVFFFDTAGSYEMEITSSQNVSFVGFYRNEIVSTWKDYRFYFDAMPEWEKTWRDTLKDWQTDNENLTQQMILISSLGVIASFGATFFGVGFGFWLDRRRESASRKERLVGALQMIRDEIQRNIELFNQILDELRKDPKMVQSYSLKTTTWEAVSSALVDLKSPTLVKDLATEYYEYEHMKRKIDARYEFQKMAAVFGTQNTQLETFVNFTKAVVVGAEKLLLSSKNLKGAIDQKLKELRSN